MRRLLDLILKPLRPYLDHRVDTMARQRLDQFTHQLEETRRASIETQRIVTDDLDASTEAAALLGDSLRVIREELATLRVEVDELRAMLAGEGDEAGGTARAGAGRGRRRA